MLRTWLCQADITLHLEPQDPVLIKSGYATLDGPDMVPVSTLRRGERIYYFPSTSLKGVLRSHFERICRTLRPGSVCIPYYDPKRSNIAIPVATERENYGCSYRVPSDGRPDTKATAYYESCAACRFFGSLRFAGRFSISDAYPLPNQAPRTGQRNGVGIDRFTGGTVPGVLFDLLVLEGGVFETEIRVLNFELWQLAAVNLLLSDLAEGLLSIGSGRSRGLGRVSGQVRRYKLSYLRPQTQVQGIAELCPPEEGAAYGFLSWPSELGKLPSLPQEGRQSGLRWEYDLTANWQETLSPLIPSLEAFLQHHPRPLGQPRD
jgi:CRISPR/Cas system CSM-associated protein Csm3 (group 7 of RAMP superfamily)